MISITGCGTDKKVQDYVSVSGLDTGEQVVLKIAIPYETNKALNTVSNAFMTKYPNVSIQLEYIEDYDTNALQLFQANELDVILQKDVFATEENREQDFFYNFASDEEIDFS
ncbi:MAG: hypothetical protein PHP50_07980 [Lachnospiraceae bacterium]|nr:hypothetical protein [Lachnospiraceae bacterium]